MVTGEVLWRYSLLEVSLVGCFSQKIVISVQHNLKRLVLIFSLYKTEEITFEKLEQENVWHEK